MLGCEGRGATWSLSPEGWSSRGAPRLEPQAWGFSPQKSEVSSSWAPLPPPPWRMEAGVPGAAGVDPRRDRLPSPGSRKRSPAPQTCYWKSEGRAAPPVPTSSSPAPPPAARAFMGTQAWTVSLKSFAPSALT